MATYRNERSGDIITVPEALQDKYDAIGHYSRVVSDGEAAELKGNALDEALEQAGLSKSGSADDKRARLAEYANTDEEIQS